MSAPSRRILDAGPICSSGKRGLPDERAARGVLAAARRGRANGHTGRRPGIVEGDVYQRGACGWWHLRTSATRQRRGTLANTKSTRRRR